MKSILIIALLSTVPFTTAFARDLQDGDDMIQEVHYQAKQCDNSAIKSAYLDEENHVPEIQIRERESKTMDACSARRNARLAAIAKAQQILKSTAAPGKVEGGLAVQKNAARLIALKNLECVNSAIWDGIQDDMGSEEPRAVIAAREARKLDACAAAHTRRSQALSSGHINAQKVAPSGSEDAIQADILNELDAR